MQRRWMESGLELTIQYELQSAFLYHLRQADVLPIFADTRRNPVA